MISYATYKVMHIVGLLLVFSAFGASFLGHKNADKKPPKTAMILHGVGLVAMLVAGFGLMARTGIPHGDWPIWIYLKFGIWLVIGALPILVRKGVLPASIGWLLGLALAGAGAWTALSKPWLS